MSDAGKGTHVKASNLSSLYPHEERNCETSLSDVAYSTSDFAADCSHSDVLIRTAAGRFFFFLHFYRPSRSNLEKSK